MNTLSALGDASGFVPAHVLTTPDPTLVAVVTLAGIGSTLLALVAAAAAYRRPVPSYLLVALAFTALAAQTGVAALTMGGMVDDVVHHHLEHGLDVLMVALVFGAVYYARRVEHGTGGSGV
ncbi:MAG: DUF7471 family protein [Halobacteriota archaeon]